MQQYIGIAGFLAALTISLVTNPNVRRREADASDG
jgi:hypothetical protein